MLFRSLLRPVTLDAQGQLHFEIYNGFLFFAANPLFLLAMVRGLLLRLPGHQAEVQVSVPLPSAGWFVAAMCLLMTCLTCMHRTLGGWQFCARYMIDLFPWLFVWFLGRPKWRPDSSAWALCGAAMLFNLYGALYMLNT